MEGRRRLDWFRDIPQSRFAAGFRDVAASRFGGGFRAVVGPVLARPTAPAIMLDPGVNAGEIDLALTALPAAWGDLLAPADGYGMPGRVEWWHAVDGWQPLWVVPIATPGDSRLRWPRPAQSNPTILTMPGPGFYQNTTTAWTNTSGNGRPNGPRAFADDEDVIILGAAAVATNGSQMEIIGGRHVAFIGAHRRGRLMYKDQTGSIWMEGCEFVLEAVAGDQDGLSVSGKAGYQPDVYIQKCLVTGIQGTNAGVHGDILQLQGPVGGVYIDLLTGNSNYQGLFLRPEYLTRGAFLSRMNLTFNDLDTPDNNTYLAWLRNKDTDPAAPGDPLYPVVFDEVYLAQHEIRTPIQAAVFPTTEAIQGWTGALCTIDGSGNVIYDGRAGLLGTVRNGAPAGGDFVLAADVGVGYAAATDFQSGPPLPAAPFFLDLSPELWGTDAAIAVRGVAAGGRTGASATLVVTVPGAPHALDTLVMPDSDPVTHLSDGPMTVLVPA